MGNITWTKAWSSSDDSTVLDGADIQNIQNDITTVVNGGITNANVNASAAIAESKIAFDTTSGHTHDGSDSAAITTSSVGFFTGCQLVYIDANDFKARPGAIEIDGSVYTRSTYSSTIALDTSTMLYGSQDAASTWYYVYAYNDTGTSWDIKAGSQAPQYSNCGTSTDGILKFREYDSVWYRCIGAVYNGSGQDIKEFIQHGDWVFYDDYIKMLDGASAPGNWTDVDLSDEMPVFSRLGNFYALAQDSNTTSWFIRNKAHTSATGMTFSCEISGQTGFILDTDSSQTIQYDDDGNGGALSLWIIGYYMGGLR